MSSVPGLNSWLTMFRTGLNGCVMTALNLMVSSEKLLGNSQMLKNGKCVNAGLEVNV